MTCLRSSFCLLAQMLVIGAICQPSRETQSVEQVLLDMEDQYQVRFSYSRDVIPCRQMVALDLDKRLITDVLEEMGEQTGIIYMRRGRRIVLSYDPGRRLSIGGEPEVEADVDIAPPEKTEPPEKESIVLVEKEEKPVLARDAVSSPEVINEAKRAEKIGPERRYEATNLRMQDQQQRQWGQVSFLPVNRFVGKKANKKNHLSLNVLAGHNGGLEGLELGGIANGIAKDVKGVQVAGITNYVGGNVEGAQVAGFGNFNNGIMKGLQVAGTANINEQASAVQIAGAFNLNRRISRGYQVAGFFNAGRNISGGQIAGFFNLSLGHVIYQTAGFCNVGEDVDVQIAGLVNVAKKVNYLQLGLINVADSVAGISFGLLNLIKKGYNKIEISFGDALYGNVAIKLGTKYFYNIFQVGTNFRENQLGSGYIWGYGYGFGFFQGIAKDLKLNPEVLVSNIQERKIIKPDLNLLGQFKLLVHFTQGKRIEVFAGPTFNAMMSKLDGGDGGSIGSQIAPYALFEKTYYDRLNPLNFKFWVGFNAGIRI